MRLHCSLAHRSHPRALFSGENESISWQEINPPCLPQPPKKYLTLDSPWPLLQEMPGHNLPPPSSLCGWNIEAVESYGTKGIKWGRAVHSKRIPLLRGERTICFMEVFSCVLREKWSGVMDSITTFINPLVFRVLRLEGSNLNQFHPAATTTNTLNAISINYTCHNCVL